MLGDVHLELAGRWPFQRRELPITSEDDGWLVLDTRRLTFACPLDLTAIVALAKFAAENGDRIRFITPSDQSVTSYLERLDVVGNLPAGTVVDGDLLQGSRTDLPDRLLEVSQLAPNLADDVVIRAGKMINSNYDRRLQVGVFQAVGELIDNAISHGSSELGAFAAAQVYTGTRSGRRGLEFAVCDTGIGILAHLQRNPRHHDLQDSPSALKRALQPGVTGTSEPRGHGLSDLWRFTENGVLARLMLRSGNGVASVVGRLGQLRTTCAASEVDVAGTWAWLRVRAG